MRVIEISDPSSYHTAQWVRQLLERNIETYVVYMDDWFDSKLDRIEGIDKCQYKLFKVPSKKSIISSLLKKGRLGTIARSVRYGTMLHSNLELVGPEINRYCKDQEIDVVHAHYVHGGGFLAYASNYLPCVLSTWGSDLTDGPEKYPYYIPMMKKTIDWATIINPASEVSANLVKTFSKVEDNRMFVSSWGADTDFFEPDLDSSELRHQLGIPDGLVILSFRTLDPYYRIDLIIRAFKIISEKYADVSLVIGNGGESQNDLEHLCEKLGIRDRVFFTGYMTGMRMAQLFSLADIYIQCPLSDGVSISGLQALAAGLPVIANNVGETQAIIENDVNGLLLDESEAPEPYAAAFQQIIEDDGLRNRMSIASRRLSELKHDRTKILAQFKQLFLALSEGATDMNNIF